MEPVTVFNFTRVYEEQTFYRDIPHEWIDCTDLSGVNGFCDDEALTEIRRRMREAKGRIHFIDGGNFHYISYASVMEINVPFTLVVFDHHTDMKPSMFEGLLSCGCWIKRALDDNPKLERVILLGVADELADTVDPEYSKRVTVIPEGEAARGSEMARGSETMEESSWLQAVFDRVSGLVYISVDKDAFSENEAATDWDQGTMTLNQLEAAVRILRSKCTFLGVDVCGEADGSAAGGENSGEMIRLNDRANRRIMEILMEDN